MNPFFSICIPASNRERTIFNTLKSVSRQSFRDFEVIIVDCCSSDNTRSEIQRFFDSEYYKQYPFTYTYVEREYPPVKVKDWNEPVSLANGTYIAMLEGDDQFQEDHLRDAFITLKESNNLGLYATGNQIHKRNRPGLVKSNDFIVHNIKMCDVPPPSEAIFIRVNQNGVPFLYNDTDYEYAPEADLYTRISLEGFDAFFSEKQDVIRDISPKPWYINTWHYVVDRFVLLDKYQGRVNSDVIKESRIMQGVLAIESSIRSYSYYSFKNLIRISLKLIQCTSLIVYLKSFKIFIYKRFDRKFK